MKTKSYLPRDSVWGAQAAGLQFAAACREHFCARARMLTAAFHHRAGTGRVAVIGSYGVLSYAVAQRRREIGIRTALGAQREQIGTQFLSLGLRLLAAGTILGLAGAWLAGRAMQSVLFDVPTLPIATLLGTALVMTAVSLIACLIPARRATKVDPMIALRTE